LKDYYLITALEQQGKVEQASNRFARFRLTSVEMSPPTRLKLSLKLALEVAPYFGLGSDEAYAIAVQVGKAVATWRKEAGRLGLTAPEINRMASAFEHDDLKAALALAEQG
jgi:serine/threonine-protein kinase HipA